jgi:hypothetical protein
MVSVSRVAGPPQIGQVVWRKPGFDASGDWPVGRNSTSSGASTGSAAEGTGTAPWTGQYTIGMGHPQKRWRDTSQSRRRKLTFRDPTPIASRGSIASAVAAVTARPSRKPLLILTPSPPKASPPPSSQPSGGCTVRTMGSPCNWAKSQSRWSSAGTAMMAPVP